MSSLERVVSNLIEKRQWDDAMASINSTDESREQLRRKEFYALHFPLHRACYLGAPPELVEAMVTEHPDAAAVTDGSGRLPLHHACGRDVSPQVVRLLLDAYPEGAKATNRWGWLPLHNAAFRMAPLDVLRIIIDGHPEGAATRDNNGLLPLHHFARQSSPDDGEDVVRVDLLSRPLFCDEEACLVPDPKSDDTPLDILVKFDLLRLHECLRVPRCRAKVIVYVADRHPERLLERDEDGRLPLHVAAANPNLNGPREGQADIIFKLVELYPDAAATPDGEGRSPLNLAIESGKRWEEGVEAIADAAKGVMTIRDVGTNLFPFMLAASSANPCMTMVYNLLRCCPEVCKKPSY